MKTIKNKTIEQIASWIFFAIGMITILCVLVITLYLISSGLPAIQKIGLKEFLFSSTWNSTGSDPKFGILPFILTSLYGTLGALLLAVPVGIGCALYLSKFAPPALKRCLLMGIQVLAGIPSVVFGLVGMVVLVPWIRSMFHLSDGACLLSAMIVLAIMILPSVVNVSLNALDAVPSEYEEASIALGATKLETVRKVSFPAARSGILASIILGTGRAIGEAMAVIMVSGNVANMPNMFQSVRFLTTAISSEMSYASGLQKEALFSIALVLFVFILLTNTILSKLMKEVQSNDSH
ncbi:phosphate ABC transporter permease subunit PstC [Dubosiella newyorkensis]|uniref:phosphate ABC transporter permease subunit PstC n=1 Tax=Dubosiella newyorkensis TaxID=1862672 RepID=UPI00248AB7F3|nr:phosphate ABC transporter permease subunit PstC [Dubosiella newyorkensis]